MAHLRTAAWVVVVVASVACGGGREGDIEAAIAEIEAGRGATPLIAQPSPGSDAEVTFLVTSSDGRVPRIVSDVTGWGESPDDSSFDLTIGTMTRVGSSDWYRLDARVAPRSRIEYLVVYGETDYQADPNNPRRAWSRGGDDISELVTPDYLPPKELSEAPVGPGGTTVEGMIDSRALGAPRRVLAHLPLGYRDDGAYPVAVFHGGWGVARDGQAPRVIDWLIAHGEIEPIVGLFLESNLEGDGDNHEGAPMRTFLTDEARGWLASRYAASADGDDWAVIGISYGAKDALDAAVSPSRAYGRLGLLIPGRRLSPGDLEVFTQQRGNPLRVAILAGRYDQANLATAQQARQALTGASHEVDYIEVPEGHNPTTWRDHLRDVLVSLFGTSRRCRARP
ncbi:MAG: alpha/beta hydrolase-fold protein [Thermoanaerobaculales bacterium]|nr:alpha/beta hydrolase-fold protein [Thermoanaerobaculales bacterium]